MENEISNLLRPNIRNLKPYSCARNEFKGTASVWLDANENPYNAPFNRYPDPLQQAVKTKLGAVRRVDSENIFLGVGSDECIDLCYRCFCRPAVDNVVAISPSYGMYEVCADINDIEYRKVPLTDTFDIDAQALIDACNSKTKVMWICSPNNPTGNAFSRSAISEIYGKFKGILVVDEAYIDFSEKGTMLEYLSSMPRLIVMQTFSKAWGSAAARLGIAFASTEIINVFNKVKYPYNINLLTQQYALERIEKYAQVIEWVATIKKNRAIFVDKLKTLKCVKTIYPTDANFILVRVDDANRLYDYLCDSGIIIRNRNRVEKCAGCVRITVGTEQENDELINAMKNYGNCS
ncbi:MAG: histidinol-phosphate transaminase [Muribaculaceae bacterium]|nr:histidinol-phosphate transaminase [Muribaculaceae bacterium]